LAMYLGYVRGGIAGATVSGVAFVLPSFLMVWALAAAYVRYDGLWWTQGLFYGVGAAVVAVIARSVLKLARLTLGDNRLRWTIAAVLAATTALTGRENVSLFILSGFIALLGVRPRSDPSAAFVILPLAAGASVAGTDTSLVS